MTTIANPQNRKSDAIDVGLFDGIFTHGNQKAINLAGDNLGEQAKYIRWHKGEYRPVTVFTDANLEDALKAPKGIRKVAWLLEPDGLRDTAYTMFDNLQFEHGCFDYVLTHDMMRSNSDERPYINGALWCPVGGAWVKKLPSTTKKTKLVSMMTTEKKKALGHKLRIQLQDHFFSTTSKIDMFGRGSVPVASKSSALDDYGFSVVIESCSIPGYFTEKLIDAFLTMTVPIYWGAPDIHRYFDPGGMIICDSEDDVKKAVQSAKMEWREKRHISLLRNQIRADFMRCAEDFAYLKYPWVFEYE